MATTPASIAQDEQDFAAAFDEDMAPAAEQTEDEAFGLSPEAVVAEESGEASPVEAIESGDTTEAAPAVAVVITPDEGEPGEGATTDTTDGAEEAAAPVVDEPAAAEPELDVEKERQRLKSWEGRIKRAQAELEAKGGVVPGEEAAAGAEGGGEGGSEVANALEDVASQAEGEGDAALADAAEQVAEQVESGAMSAEAAMRQLAEDFGEDFVKMIETIASAKAREAGAAAAAEKVGEIGSTVDDIINDINDSKARAHFKAIADAHPDFNEVGKSAEFKSYVDSLPDGEREEAQRAVEGGSAQDIVALLSAYKAAGQGGEPEPVVEDTAAVDAAEGVRSSGLTLPETPKPAADSFEEAWDEF